MSALAAVLQFHSSLASAERLQRLLDLQLHAGPDGQARLTSEPFSTGLCVMTTTPEDHLDPPCVHDCSVGVTVAIDGYLSNRGSVADALGVPPAACAGIGDARLIARAYRRWGTDAFTRLDGVYAIALWDSQSQTCVIARDVFGIRPVYYAWRADALCVASELQALYREQPSAINEGMVAEALVWRRASVGETLFSGIKRLPPAHVLIVRNGQARVQRYWTPNLDRTLPCLSEQEIDEACRSCISQAVDGVLRSDRPVALMLSGGMDSGVIAAEGVRARARSAIRAFTTTFPDTCVDEGPWAHETATHMGLEWTPVLPAAREYDFMGESRRTLQLPSYPSNANSVTLRSAAVAADCRVLVTGMGGDEWFYGSDWRYADLLRRGRVVEWTRELWSDGRISSLSWRRILRDSVLPMIPRHRWRQIRAVMGGVSERGLINDGWSRRVDLEDRLALGVLPSAQSHARRDIGRIFDDAGAVAAHEEMAQLGYLTGTTHRHPFYSRGLVEFALALPEEQRRRRGVTKRVLRRAYSDALPAGVLSRVECFTYDFLNTEAIRALLTQGLFDDPWVVKQGWVDPEPLAQLISAVSHGPVDGAAADAAMQLWPTASVEVWLNAMLR